MTAATLRHRARGAALAETAVVISFVLLLLFGTLQIILIGYLQVAGDAAVFVAAHEYTLGVSTTTIASAEESMVPNIVATAITYNAATPNPVTASVFNGIYGVINQGARNGGYAMVRPQNFQVSLSNSGANAATYNGILGFNRMPISSGAVEGYYLMSNDVMDNSGDGPNDAGVLNSTVLNAANASPFEPNSDKLATNMNVPPYYAPTATMQFCADPWISQATTTPRFTDACANPESWALGMAEYLDNNNYVQTYMGVGLNGVFEAMAAHQRVYANLINAFPVATDQGLAAVQGQFENYTGTTGRNPDTGLACSTTTCGAKYTPTSATFNNLSQPLYNYDPMNYWGLRAGSLQPSWMGGFGGARTQLWTNETSANGAELSLDPGGDGVEGPAAWGGASPALVYEWDQPNGTVNPVGPGLYPLHPLAGTGTSGDPGY